MPFSGCIHMALPSGIASGAWLWRGQNSRLLCVYIYYIFPCKFKLQRNIYIYMSPLKINGEYIDIKMHVYRCRYIHACVCGDIMMDASPDF